MRREIQKIDQIVAGSLAQISKDSGKPLAETFLSADCIVIVDVSSSMEDRDALDGKSRYETACNELAALQKTLPGRIAVIAFSSTAVFCPNGIPLNMGGGTDLADALRFAKVADVDGMRFIVISDGQPDSEERAMAIARSYKNKIDVVYVGPETRPTGRDFLMRLAQASGGQAVTADRVAQLSTKVQYLLAA